MKTRAIFFAAILPLAALTNATAGVFSLTPIADARVINYPGYQNKNFGSEILSVYTAASENNTQRTFIYFDVSSITVATNEAVQNATLSLVASTSFGINNSNRPMEIYRVVAPWTEASLTWTNRDATHAWTNSGGDFIGIGGQPYAVSTASPTNGGTVTWDITALVQEWVTHTSPNYGLLLKSSDGNRLTFVQRESGTVVSRPNLTVTIGVPPLHAGVAGGNVLLWWIGNGLVLQEKTNLNPALIWTDSSRTVTQSGNSNAVTISMPVGNRFFRLRSGP